MAGGETKPRAVQRASLTHSLPRSLGRVRPPNLREESRVGGSGEREESVSRFVEKGERGRCLVIIVSLDTVRGKMETRKKGGRHKQTVSRSATKTPFRPRQRCARQRRLQKKAYIGEQI